MMAWRRDVGIGTLLALACCTPSPGEAGDWRLQASLGGARSFASTLTLTPTGVPEREISAEWDNRNFESPLYYSLAAGYGPWAVRLVHLKVFLSNPPSGVERFSVSHGYNLLTVERSFPLGGFDLVAGLGVVIAHPEVTLSLPDDAGPTGDSGYTLTGPTGALGMARNIRLGERISLVPEVRFTLSRAVVPVSRGEASVPNASIHLLVGLELRL